MVAFVRMAGRAGSLFAVLFALTIAGCGDDPTPADTGQTVDTGNDTTGDLDAGDTSGGDADADMGADLVPDEGIDLAPDTPAEDADAVAEVVEDADADVADMGPDETPDLVDEPDTDTGIDPTILRIPPLERNPINVEASVRIAEPIVLPEALGGTTPYTYRTSALPAGVTFDAASRSLSGRPLTEGPRAVTYTVRDAMGEEAQRNFVINVGADMTAPEAPGNLTFVDDESVPSTIRPADFGFEWDLSLAPDVASQNLYLLPAGETESLGDPVAMVDDTTDSVTLEAAADSLGACLRPTTAYRLIMVMEDESGNTAPIDPLAPTEDEADYYLDFTSDPGDGENGLQEFYFDVDPFGDDGEAWSASAEGESSSIDTLFDEVNDASSCPASGSLQVTNSSDGGEAVSEATVAVVGQCVRVNSSREYGYSADFLVPSEQERTGYAVMSVTWFRSSDCSGAPTGTGALDTVEDSEDVWVFRSQRVVPPVSAGSALVELRTVKQPAPSEAVAAEPFVAWYDNVFFGPID